MIKGIFYAIFRQIHQRGSSEIQMLLRGALIMKQWVQYTYVLSAQLKSAVHVLSPLGEKM